MISERRPRESFEGYRCFNDRFGSCRSMCPKHAKTVKVRPPCRETATPVMAAPAIDTFPETSKCVANLINRLKGAKTFSHRLRESA